MQCAISLATYSRFLASYINALLYLVLIKLRLRVFNRLNLKVIVSCRYIVRALVLYIYLFVLASIKRLSKTSRQGEVVPSLVVSINSNKYYVSAFYN